MVKKRAIKRQFLLLILTIAIVLTAVVTHTVVSAHFSQRALFECARLGRDDQACRELEGFDHQTLGSPSAIRTVSNEGLSITLNFMGTVPLAEGVESAWTEAAQRPYVDVSKQWLEIVSGVQGVKQHHLSINFGVMDVGEDALGFADINFEKLKIYGSDVIPTQGYIAIGDIFYTEPELFQKFGREDVVYEELKALIAHEIGHVLGIGILWNIDLLEPGQFEPSSTEYTGSYRNWSIKSPFDHGLIYRKPNSAAIARFNRMFGTNYDFLPITEGHPYNFEEQRQQFGGNGRRFDGRGGVIPEMGWELMGHGTILSPITIGLIEDLGWSVNNDAIETFLKRS